MGTFVFDTGNVRFTFAVHTASLPGPDGPGLYMLAKPASNGWFVFYIGQSKSVLDRLTAHERWDEARTRGMTHVLRLPVPLQADRDRYEKMLIQAIKPPMNTMHMPAPGFGSGLRR